MLTKGIKMPSIQSQRRSREHRLNSPSVSSISGSEQAGASVANSSEIRQHQHQHQQQHQQAPDANAKQLYNYGVLTLHDPKLAQIFATSSICNVYKYNIDNGEWEKLDCQGTLFVYSRRQDMPTNSSGNGKRRRGKKGNASDTQDQQEQQQIDPYSYGLMVLNRLSLENFSLGITPLSVAAKLDLPEMEVKLEDPFIMVEAADGEIYGLWLFHEADRPIVEGMIKWCLNAQI